MKMNKQRKRRLLKIRAARQSVEEALCLLRKVDPGARWKVEDAFIGLYYLYALALKERS